MTRRRLPNRRAHEAREIEFDGRRFSLGVCFDDIVQSIVGVSRFSLLKELPSG